MFYQNVFVGKFNKLTFKLKAKIILDSYTEFLQFGK